jgi:bacterial/archaeal transporter family-2 protein
VDRTAAVSLTVLAGGLVALQAPMNSVLGRHVGTIQSAFVNFLIGTLVLALAVAFVRGGFGRIGEIREAAWWTLLGGLMGVAYVTCVLVTVRSLGAGGVTAATLAGQLAASVVVDHYGWLGVEKSPVTALKLIGIVLLALGTYLVVRE